MKNFLSSISTRIVNTVLTLLSTPILLLHLGQTGYGFIVLIQGIVGFGGILDLGLNQSLVRAIAGASAEEKESIYSTAIRIFLCIILAFTCMTFLFWDKLINYLSSLGLVLENIDSVLLCLMLSCILKVISNFFGAIMYAEEQIHEVNFAQVVGSVTRLGLFIVMSIYQFSIESVLYALPLSFISTIVLQKKGWVSIKSYNHDAYSNTVLRNLVYHASTLFLTQAFGEITLNADKLIVTSILGLKALAPYNIAYLLVARLNDLGSIVASVVFPRINANIKNNEIDDGWAMYSKAQYYTFMLALPLALFMNIFGPQIVTWWINEQTSIQVNSILLLFSLGAILSLPNWLNGNMLIIFGQTEKVLFSMVVGALIALVLCYKLTTLYGLWGAVAAWSISYILVACVQFWLVYKFCNEKYYVD